MQGKEKRSQDGHYCVAPVYFQILFTKDRHLFQGALCLGQVRNEHAAAEDQRAKDKLGILLPASLESTQACPNSS